MAPTPLISGSDLGRPDLGWSWRVFGIVEVTAERAPLRLRYPAANDGATGFIDLPPSDALRRVPPD